jgi:2-(1,2-epoxy-1,2-dihydrophenyl)acetyl-CoA isomerase
MQFETLVFARSAGVAAVTLNRPDQLNALNAQLIKDLKAAAGAIAADDTIRSVLLTGAGRAFCSGADLRGDDFSAGGADAAARAATSMGERIGAVLREHFNPMVSAWYHLRVPVVVAVNGIAAGAGCSLALAGDIVLAARSASFVQLFAPKLGLMPDLGATFHVPRMVGAARAKGLALLGEALSATDAADWGLIWSAVEDADLATAAARIARQFANGPTNAYMSIKAALNLEPPPTLDEQLNVEARDQARLADTADFAEGIEAFRNKRAPRFTGR